MPDEYRPLLEVEGHQVVFLREVLETDTPDAKVLEYVVKCEFVLVTCNREDFIELGKEFDHHGIVLVFRRRTRMAEKAALLRLIRSAGKSGLSGNVNYA